MLRRDMITRTAFTMLTLAGFVLLAAGCADLGQAPLAPERAAVTSSDSQPLRAPKPGGRNHATVTSSTLPVTSDSEQLYYQDGQEMVSHNEGCRIRVHFPNYGGPNDITVRDVVLEVAPGAIVGGTKVKIKMEAYSGYTLEDVHVIFDPSGVVFDPPGTVTISLRGPVTPEDVLLAQHVYGDGYVETIVTDVDVKNGEKKVDIDLRVPGFSRYSLGGDDYYGYPEAEDDECLVP